MAFLLLPLLWLAPVTLAHGQAMQAHRKKKGVASFRGFAPEQLPLVRQLYLKPVRRGEVQCRQQLLHLLLVAQPSVDNPKLFIHTEALVVPGQEVEVGAEVGLALGCVCISVVLIITLSISDEGSTTSTLSHELAAAPHTLWKATAYTTTGRVDICSFVCLWLWWECADGEHSL